MKHPRTRTPKNSHYYGTHAVSALLDTRFFEVMTLFYAKDSHPLVDVARAKGISVQKSDSKKLEALCGNHAHQGIVAFAKTKTPIEESDLLALANKPDALFLVLDQVTDAHNLGACLRTGCVMGVDAVIAPIHQSASITPTCAKVAVGAVEMLPFCLVTNLARTLAALKSKGVFVYGTALDENSQALHNCDLTGKIALVLGSEGKGMRCLTQNSCDGILYIPMSDGPRPDSLNVSVAAGMALYEARRQRS